VPSARADAIRRILAEHDPLPPWLSEAHWDDDYYEREAADIARQQHAARSIADIRDLVIRTFDATLPGVLDFARQTDDRLDSRLDAIALAIWRETRSWGV
jgi:hypothetical protein